MLKKVPSASSLATLVAAIAAAALVAVAGPADLHVQRPANAGTAHVFVPTTVSIPESDTEPAPTF